MKPRATLIVALLLALVVAGSSPALPLLPQDKKKDEQKKTDQQKADEQKKKDAQQQPAPLFQGNVGLKSSHQGKDSATLGFNGVGPNGEVEQRLLDAAPTSADLQKANDMGNRKVATDALQLFILEGQLNPEGAAKSAK